MDLSQSDWKYVDERAGAFVGREWVFAQVRSFLSGPPGTFLLRGDPGTGKTAVAARLAQASCGRLDAADSPPPVGGGVISAGVFCRAGKATVAELAQRLSDQLAASVDGFADALRATAEPGITIRDVHVDVQGDVHAGGTVSGVVLPRQDGKQAFSTGVAVPLRHLRERGAAEPIVLLVDAVDEAADVGEVNIFSRLLANLDDVHMIVTCRPDPPVLSDFRAAAHKLDLIADAPADDDDVRRYIRNRLSGQGPEEAVGVLAGRVSGEADGNFLYAFYVTGTLTGSGSLAGSDEKTARGLPLPTGGLAGVYEDFLDRQIAGDETRWAGELRPVLAPLCVAQGDGLTTAQLAAIASRLTGQDFSVTRAGDVIRAAGQFLDGPDPSGRFRVYHQSFSRFLTDPGQNPNWPIDLTETNSAVARGLIGTVPEGQPGVRDWAAASDYVHCHLAAHAAAAGILDDLLPDSGYLLAADPPGLLAVLSEARSQAARRASAAYRRVVHRLADPSKPARDCYLRLAALQAGADELLTEGNTDADHGAEGPGWLPAWAWWRPAMATRVVGELPSEAAALATLVTEQGPLAVAGGEFGLEAWNLDSGQRLAAHPWKIRSLAVGQAGGRPVVLAGHDDGTVSVHELPSLQVVARNESAHTGGVRAAVTLGDGSMVATGDEKGALVLWQLPALQTLAVRPQAHTAVAALAGAAAGGVPLLISAGSRAEQDDRNSGGEPVRAWTLPGLHLHSGIETAGYFSGAVAAASTPLGCAVAFEKDRDVQVELIAADGGVKPIGTVVPGRTADTLLVLREGDEPLIMVCSRTLAPLRISLQPVPALTLGSPVEMEAWTANWAGPIDLMGRRFLVSATSTLRVLDLEEVLAASSGQGDLPQREAEHQVAALAAAGDVLAALTGDGSVRRWRWRSAEALQSLTVRPEPIQTLASCVLAGRPHFVVAYGDGIVEAFDAESGGRWPARVEVTAPLQAMAVGDHGGQTVAATAVQLGLEPGGSFEGDRPVYGVRLWDLTTGAEIPTRKPEDIWRRLGIKFMWKLTTDEEITHLAAVETAGDLNIAASDRRGITVWPLNDMESKFDMRHWGQNITALAGQQELLATRDLHGWEIRRLNNRADYNSEGGVPPLLSKGKHFGVGALAFGSWQGAPALLSGGAGGWLRLWSQSGTQIRDIDIDEPVTSVAFLPEDGMAVGTRRGVVIIRLADVGIRHAQGPLEAKVASLRAAVREQRDFYWNWREWNIGIFPPATPESYSGPVAEIVELITGSPAETFRALSSWLDDATHLASTERSTVADVACALMAAYSHSAFDDLCEVVADTQKASGTGSADPIRLLKVIMESSADAGTNVCERWSAKEGKRAELASVCAHSILRTEPPPELRARLLAVETRILSANPTPAARTEALHALAARPETRGLVIDELIDRFLGRAEGDVDTRTLSHALATHFDLVFNAFNQELMRYPFTYDHELLWALADYAPTSDAEAERILGLFELRWDTGPDEPASAMVESLVRFAAHGCQTRDRAVVLAFRIAQSSDSLPAYEHLAWAAFTEPDPEFRRKIFDAVIESADPKMKETLVSELVHAIHMSEDKDETLFEPALRAAATELEAQEVELVFTAESSRKFASALARAIQHTTFKSGGLLAMFAELASHDPDPQNAARQAIESN